MATTQIVGTAPESAAPAPLPIPAPPATSGLVAQGGPTVYPGMPTESLVAYNTPSDQPGDFLEQVAGPVGDGGTEYFWSNPEAGVATPWSSDPNAGLQVLQSEFPGLFTPPASQVTTPQGTTPTASPDPNTGTDPNAAIDDALAALISGGGSTVGAGGEAGGLSGDLGVGSSADGTTIPSDIGALNAAAPVVSGSPATTTGASSGEIVLIVGVIVIGFVGWFLYSRWKKKHAGPPHG